MWQRNTWFLLTARFLSTQVYTSVCCRVAVDTTSLFVTPPLRFFFFSSKMFFLLELLDPSRCTYRLSRKVATEPEGRRSHLLIVLFISSAFSNSGCVAKFFPLHLTLNRRFPIFRSSIMFAHVKNSPEGTVSFILTYLPHTSSPLYFHSFLNISAAYDWHSAWQTNEGGCFLLSNPVIIPRNF